jgi:murein DD-endopeptidase MepM/ murein hydrolase activator NlpD
VGGPRASLRRRAVALAAAVVGLVACGEAPSAPRGVSPPGPAYVAERWPRPIGPEPETVGPTLVERIGRNESLSDALRRIGVKPSEVDEIARALLDHYDFRRAQPGHLLELERRPDGKLGWFRYTAGPRAVYHATRGADGALVGASEAVFVARKVELVDGVIDVTLWGAVEAAGEKPGLFVSLVDLFAWDLDFYTETQTGDRFRLIVEKEFIDGRFVGYGPILGAEYHTASGRRLQAFFYRRPDGTSGYYTADGTSVKKAFLKSPIQFTSITSGFGLRRHPILEYVGTHKGIDYAAPTGTSIWSVADGVVTRAGWGGGYGNVVFVKHANGTETRYAHMSRIATGVRAGKRVGQKQTLGYVGATGLATGPHLHFEVLVSGRHTNPLKLAAPPAPPIVSEEMPAFRAAIAAVEAAIADGDVALAARPLGAPPAAGAPSAGAPSAEAPSAEAPSGEAPAGVPGPAAEEGTSLRP